MGSSLQKCDGSIVHNIAGAIALESESTLLERNLRLL